MLLGMFVQAQTGIKVDEANTNRTPDASAILDAEATTKGILIPQLSLTATNVAAPVVTPANSLLIFNTANTGTGITAVTPGFYYWDTLTDEWVRLLDPTDSLVTIDSAEWIDGSQVGLVGGNIYARKALAKGDTVVIDTLGNLGIGKTPNSLFILDLKGDYMRLNGTSDADLFLNLTDSNAVSSPEVQFKINDVTKSTIRSQHTTKNLVISESYHPGFSTVMVLDSGRVGIGTTSPAAKLDINSNNTGAVAGLRVDARLNGTGPGLKILADTRSTLENIVEVDDNLGNSNFVIKSTGRVGLGTTNPTYEFHILDTANAQMGQWVQNTNATGNLASEILLVGQGSGKYGYLAYHNDNYSNGLYPNLAPNTTLLYGTQDLVLNSGNSSYDIKFGNAIMANESMVIKGNGNVGIGEPNPTHQLHVSSVSTNRIIALERTGVFPNKSYLGTNRNNPFIVDIDNGNSVEDFVVDTNVYVGINTNSPLGRLHVENDQDGIRDSVFVVRNNGHVGVGTPSPTSKVDIEVPLGFGAFEVTTPNSSFFIQEDSDILGYTNFRNNGGKGFVLSALADNPDIVIKDTLLGSVGFGTFNPAAKLHIANVAGPVDFRYGDLQDATGAGGQGIVFDGGRSYYKIASPAATKILTFYNTNGEVGSIETSGTTTTFNTTSDQRLKTNFKEVNDAIAKVSAIDVKEYAYKNDTSIRMDGFLAQQLEDIVPYAVSGSKYDKNYNPLDQKPQNPMMVDYSKLVPLLTKAIQEQQLLIEELKKENSVKQNQINDLKTEVNKISELEKEFVKIKLLLDKNDLGDN